MPGRRNTSKQFSRTIKTALPDNISNLFDGSSSTKSNHYPLKNGIPLIFFTLSSKLKRCLSNRFLFESIFCLYLIFAFLTQFLYIYRTVWWYPEKIPPSSTTVNFHLIDINLTILLFLLFGFFLVKTILWDVVRPKDDKLFQICMWNLITFLLLLAWCMEVIRNMLVLYKTTGLLQFASLSYPLITYLGYAIGSRGNIWNDLKQCFYRCGKNLPNSTHWKRLQNHYDFITQQENLMESQVQEPDKIREDVEILLADCNNRISEVVLRAFFCAYYAGFIPMCFTKNQQFIDYSWSLQHVLLILINSTAMLTTHIFSCEYLWVLHKTSLLLGKFELLCEDNDSDRETIHHNVKLWSSSTVYLKNDVVSYNNKLYVAASDYNVAQPGDESHHRFYSRFVKPISYVTFPLILVIFTSVYQLFLMFFNSFWERICTQGVLAFFSHFFLYCNLRNRLVLKKQNEHFTHLVAQVLSQHLEKSKIE